MAMEVGRRALDVSFRAIDAYRKTLLIDKVTSNDDLSPPVYLLNELSDILRSCSTDLTQEIVEYTFRRLRHQNPQVKYKVLRFIKYTLSRAGSAVYRRELQRNSPSIRALFNFQGHADPFKGNTINEAVRDAAHEAIKAIFSCESSQPTSKNTNYRIEGFGSGDFSEYVGSSYRGTLMEDTERGSLQHHGSYDYGYSYRGTLTEDTERGSLQHHGSYGYGYSESMTGKEDGERNPQKTGNGKPKSESEKVYSAEEELLERVVASQGLRLRPTHECLQLFLSTAEKLDAVKIGLALEARLRSRSWQVQFKALCVLQALLQHNDASLLRAIEPDEKVFHGCVQECLLSPQTTLRKQAKEVLESLQAAKKAKDPYGLPEMRTDNTPDMVFFTLEPNESKVQDSSFVSPSPARAHTDQVVDLLSLQDDDFAEVRAVEASPISVMDDPFEGMSIYGSKESHLEDLLTGEDLGYSAHSKGITPDLQNLNALYMFPSGNIGSPHNVVTLKRPGGTQCFDLGINSGSTSFNGTFASGRHALGDTYFKEFGLSN